MRFWFPKFLIIPVIVISVPGMGPAQQVPIDQIPRLDMFDEGVDYRKTLLGGVLAPDRIDLVGSSVRVNQKEPALVDVLGPDFTILEIEKQRTLDEQWAYLRNLSSKHDDSMYYYILSDI